MVDMASPRAAGPAAVECCGPAAGLDPGLDAERLAAVGRALAEPARIQILDALRRAGAPVCQCELIPLLEIGQSLLSHHLRKLTEAGLVRVERRHRWAYYSPVPDAAGELARWLS